VGCSQETACNVNAAISALAKCAFVYDCLHKSIDLADYGCVIAKDIPLCKCTPYSDLQCSNTDVSVFNP
jgi:hypothetical protein